MGQEIDRKQLAHERRLRRQARNLINEGKRMVGHGIAVYEIERLVEAAMRQKYGNWRKQ